MNRFSKQKKFGDNRLRLGASLANHCQRPKYPSTFRREIHILGVEVLKEQRSHKLNQIWYRAGISKQTYAKGVTAL